jgi:hypothetical protein
LKKRKQPEQDTNEAGAVDRELPDADTTPDVTAKYLSGRNYGEPGFAVGGCRIKIGMA